jgi:2-polyprenyl-6-methoxyphenol hydroxylase-like FAD-dependent oxidoreductase
MPERHAVVVGGSLSGLSAGLALARAGWRVTILERATGEPPGGAGLGLERPLLARVTGVDASRIPVVSGNRDSAAWGLVREFLLEQAVRLPGLDFRAPVLVSGVRSDSAGRRAIVESTAGLFPADVVVGADGVSSVTRRFVSPDAPTAGFAGYMLWRGLVPEAEVPGGLQGRGRHLEVHSAPGYELVIYGVPGPDGSTAPGHRRVSYAWYDAGRTELLRDSGCVRDGAVVGTLYSDRLPASLTAELASLARRWWPDPWAECIAWGVTHGEVFGTPVAEYLPVRLTRDEVALVGDAAHVATPMTGAGFHNALLDVEVLATVLAGEGGTDGPAALRRYEERRLPQARRLVQSGMAWSRSFRTRTQPDEETQR